MAHKWDEEGFEANPENSDSPSAGAGEIRDTRIYTREAMDQEHYVKDKDVDTSVCWHKPGSAVAYFQSAAPTTRPDGEALTSGDECRLWIDSDDKSLNYWDGTSAFEEAAVHDIVDQAGGANVRVKVFTGASVSGVATFAHGLTGSKIRGVACTTQTTGTSGVASWYVTGTNLVITLTDSSSITVVAIVFYVE